MLSTPTHRTLGVSMELAAWVGHHCKNPKPPIETPLLWRHQPGWRGPEHRFEAEMGKAQWSPMISSKQCDVHALTCLPLIMYETKGSYLMVSNTELYELATVRNCHSAALCCLAYQDEQNSALNPNIDLNLNLHFSLHASIAQKQPRPSQLTTIDTVHTTLAH